MHIKVQAKAKGCGVKVFTVGLVGAELTDFGSLKDLEDTHIKGEGDTHYGCENGQFVAKPSSIAVLEKYHIDEAGYAEVVDALSVAFNIGGCCRCIEGSEKGE